MRLAKRAPRIKAGTVAGRKLKPKQQLTLAGTCSEFWRQQVQYNAASFPPAADSTPMRSCGSNRLNRSHFAPIHFLTRNPKTGQLECEDCLALQHDRRMARLRREALLTNEQMEEEREHARARRNGLPVTHSASAAAFIALGNAGAQVIEMKLPTQNPRILKQQIGRYLELEKQVGPTRAVMLTFGESP